MSELSEAKRKKRNLTRFFILLMIYFMALGTAAAVTAGIPNVNVPLAVGLIVGVTVIYWAAFYIIIRRSNQKGNK